MRFFVSALHPKPVRKLFALTALAAALQLSACSQLPSYQTPKVEVPMAWSDSKSAAFRSVSADETIWWRQVSGDNVLPTLIDEALMHNRDLKQANVRLQQARALLKQSQAQRFPDLNASAGASRTQSSDELYPLNQGATFSHFSLGALLSYELDLWGRVDASVKQSEALFKASEADRQTVVLSLSAAVAKAYLNLMALNQNVQLAENTVQSRQETLALRQTQLKYGSVTPLTVQQAQAELASVEVSLHQLQERRDLQKHALGVLLGRSPKAMVALSERTWPTEPLTSLKAQPVPAGLPSDLLQRRPDIHAAEQRLIAANANIGVARAALFPSVSLTGLIGFQSEALGDLLSDKAVGWNGSADVSAPIFDSGSRQAQVTISEAEKEAMVTGYRYAIQLAFKEVLDGLIQIQASEQQLQAQQRQVSALSRSLQLARKRFDAGYSSYLEVLDAQRQLFTAQLAQVTMQLNHSKARVSLYKALGGHWQSPTERNSAKS